MLVAHAAGGLHTATCADATFCLAVDDVGNVLTYDGTSWSAPALVAPGRVLNDVSCSDRTHCVAVDDNGGVFTWDGTRWSNESVVDAGRGLMSVSCWAPGSCVAGDAAQQVVVQSNGIWGTPVLVAPTTNPRPIRLVACSSSTLCVAVTWWGDLYASQGASWVDLSDSAGGSVAYMSATCSSTGCLVGDYVGRLIQISPSLQSTWFTTSRGNAEVACTVSGRCLSVTDPGGASAGDLHGGPWSIPTSVPFKGGVACGDPDLCVLVSGDTAAVTRLG